MIEYIKDVITQNEKLDWAFPFQRTGSFPLDRSSLFTSYEDAVLYATGKSDSRGLSGSSYAGQTIAVFNEENNLVTLYIIQPDRTLTEVGSGNNSNDLTELLSKIENLQNNTYTKTEIETAIAAAINKTEHLSRKIVNSYNDIDVTAEDASVYIYMVPTGLQQDDDKYDEYIVIDGFIEKVGSWEVDLKDYIKIEDVNKALDKKVDKEDNARLFTFTEAEKLLNIQPNAEVNFINAVNEEEFTIGEARTLNLNKIPIAKVTNLTEILNNKINFTSLDKNEFIINDSNIVTINKIPIAKITNLAESLNSKVDLESLNNNHFTVVDGSISLKESYINNLVNDKISIDSLNKNHFIISNGAISLKENYVTTNIYATEVGDLSKLKHTAVLEDGSINENSTLVDEINYINERLIWGEMTL